MANKYVDVSATYNGDGTASNQAASAGAAGAWNNLVNCFAGSPGYGTLAAGDVVTVRTYNGGNLGQTLGASLTFSTTPTSAAPIKWVFDAGTIWSAGLFTLTIPGTYTVTFKDYHNFIGNDALKFYDSANGDHQNWLIFTTQEMRAFRMSQYPVSGNAASQAIVGNNKILKLINVKMDFFKGYSSVGYTGITIGDSSSLVLINPTIDLGASYSLSSALFVIENYGSILIIQGGSIINGVETRYLYSCGVTLLSGRVMCNGFYSGAVKIDNEAVAKGGVPVGVGVFTSISNFSNIPGGKFDFFEECQGNTISWRNNQNYPTLNAQLPDNTYWSMKVLPRFANQTFNARCTTMQKLYTLAAATKTITIEMLINQSYGTLLADDWYMIVSYIDNTTGLSTSSLVENLASSTAAWSGTSYGAENYDKYKLTYTTPTTILQYSDITVQVFSRKAPPSTTSFYFVDPDFTIT